MSETRWDWNIGDACSNINPCPCPAEKCKNHGHCCVCIAKHKKAGNVPYCLRETVEQMHARRIENNGSEPS